MLKSEIPPGAVMKKGPSGETREDKIKNLAHHLWEAAGGPNGMSDHFWHAAEEQLYPPLITDWICDRCGTKAYYDGRCGDGPIPMCHCWGSNIVAQRN